MKKNLLKKIYATFLCAILFALMLPFGAVAETGTLGTENPCIYCSFSDSEGNRADGDNLSPGTYTVNLMLSGMKAISICDITAEFDETVLSNVELVSTIADTNSQMSCGAGYVEENRILVIVASENEDTTYIDRSGTVIASLSVTVLSACDFEEVFFFNEDPAFTFTCADYGDDVEPCYVSVNAEGESEYWYKKITFNVSPPLAPETITVSGNVVIATNTTGTAGTVGIRGISVKVNGVVVGEASAVDGSFSVSVPAGSTELVFTGPTTIDRTVSISGDANVVGVTVPIVICDYNKDGIVNGADSLTYAGALKGTYNVYCDFNGDGSVNGADSLGYVAFLNKTVTYADLTLE